VSRAGFVTLEDVLAVTRCVAVLARDGRPETPESVARRIRDRALAAPSRRGARPPERRRADVSLGAAAEALLREARLDRPTAPPGARQMLRAAAAVCAVLVEDDPPTTTSPPFPRKE
jgi:hypothetical protein